MKIPGHVSYVTMTFPLSLRDLSNRPKSISAKWKAALGRFLESNRGDATSGVYTFSVTLQKLGANPELVV